MAADISRRALIAGGVAVISVAGLSSMTATPLDAKTLTGMLAADEELVGTIVQRQSDRMLWLATNDHRLMGLMSWPGKHEGVTIPRGSCVWLARQKGFQDDGELHYAVRARVLRWADADTDEARYARALNRISAMRTSSWVKAHALSAPAARRIDLQLDPGEDQKIMAQCIQVRRYGDLWGAHYGETFKVRLGHTWHGWDIFGARRIGRVGAPAIV